MTSIRMPDSSGAGKGFPLPAATRRYWLAVELRYYVRRAFSAALALLGGAR